MDCCVSLLILSKLLFNILKTDENPIEQVSIDCQEKYALALVLIYDGL